MSCFPLQLIPKMKRPLAEHTVISTSNDAPSDMSIKETLLYNPAHFNRNYFSSHLQCLLSFSSSYIPFIPWTIIYLIMSKSKFTSEKYYILMKFQQHRKQINQCHCCSNTGIKQIKSMPLLLL